MVRYVTLYGDFFLLASIRGHGELPISAYVFCVPICLYYTHSICILLFFIYLSGLDWCKGSSLKEVQRRQNFDAWRNCYCKNICLILWSNGVILLFEQRKRGSFLCFFHPCLYEHPGTATPISSLSYSYWFKMGERLSSYEICRRIMFRIWALCCIHDRLECSD